MIILRNLATSEVLPWLNFFTFPGGERNVTVTIPADAPKLSMLLEVSFRDSHDLIDFMLVCDALARLGRYPFVLIPYFPYARQDRVCNPGEALSVKVIADLIQEVCTSTKIEIWDPHSDVVAAMFPPGSIKIIEQHELAAPFFVGWDQGVIVAPDAGAEKKAFKLAKHLGFPLVKASKQRDPKTGEIHGSMIDNWAHMGIPNDAKFIIVDDICDGGRTFIELATAMRKLGATGELHLYVTHGIFSRGIGVFRDLFTKIYCPNVMNDAWVGGFKNGVCDVKTELERIDDDSN